MSSPTSLLRSATTFPELLAAARPADMQRLLDQRLLDWLRGCALDGKTGAHVQVLVARKLATTLGELLERKVPQDRLRIAGSKAIHAAVLEAVRATLLEGAADPAPQPQGQPAPGASTTAWAAWADACGLRRVLEMPVLELAHSSDHRNFEFEWRAREKQWTVGDVLALSKPTGYGAPTAEIRKNLCTRLAKLAAEHAEAVRETPELNAALAIAPADAEVAEVWDGLQRLRAQLLPVTQRRPTRLSCDARIEVLAEPVRVVVTESAGIWCSGGKIEPLTLQWTDQQIIAKCGCKVFDGKSGFCALPLSGVEAVLLKLKESPELAHRVATERKRPWWDRALADLDAGGTLQPGATGELGWKLTVNNSLWKLTAVIVQPRKRGDGVKKTAIRVDALMARTDLDLLPADLEAAEMMMERPYDAGEARDQALRALERLSGHPRLYLDDRPLTVLRDTPRLAVRQDSRKQAVVEVAFAGQVFAPSDFLHLPDPEGGFLARLSEAVGTLHLGRAGPQLLQTVAVLARRDHTFPREATPGLIERLVATRAPLELAPALRGREIQPDARLYLRLDVLEGGGLLAMARVQPLGQKSFEPGTGLAELLGLQGGEPAWVKRELAMEAAVCRDQCTGLGLVPGDGVPAWTWTLETEAGADLLAELAEPREDVVVQWTAERRRRVRTVSSRDLRVTLAQKRDWFAVEGGVTLDGQHIAVADLLAALRSGKRYVQLGGEDLLRLSDDLRRALQPVADLADQGKDGLRLSPLHAAVWTDQGEAKLDAPPAWHQLGQRVREAQDLDAALPDGLQADLRPYQIDGFRWLVRTAAWAPGAVLADDMGLGKTLQALAFLLHRQTLGPALVVAPVSVNFNWLREAERFVPGLKVRTFRDVGPAGLAGLAAGEVVVIGYDLLIRNVEALAQVPWATVVLDEAQAVKNASTRRAQAMAQVPAGFRLALTGTPVENRVSELWSLLRIAVPGLLGSWESFRERFATPIERYGDLGQRQALARIVRGFVLRRLKQDVAKELPARTEITLDVVPSADERLAYETHRAAILAALTGTLGNLPPEQRRFQVLAGLTKLRQLACDGRLVDPERTLRSTKIEALVERVLELRAEGHRALVFSQFVRLLELARTALTEEGVAVRWLTGDTPEKQRRVEVDAFQSGEGDVFLLSLKAGGTGLNLTGADYVLHLDPWWNPAVEDQATDRAHRIGQTRPVTVYRLVTRGTVEEAILRLHAEKRELVAGLLDGTGAAAAMTTDDLLGLLQHAATPAEDAAVEVAEAVVKESPVKTAAKKKPAVETAPVAKGQPGRRTETAVAPVRVAPVLKPALGEAIAGFRAQLQEDVAQGRLGEKASAMYARPLERWRVFLEAQGETAMDAASLERAHAAYLQAVQAGNQGLPKSDSVVGDTALRRFRSWWSLQAESL